MSVLDEFFYGFPLKLAVVAAVLTTTTTLVVGIPPLVVVVRCVMAFLAFLILGMLLIGLWDLISTTGLSAVSNQGGFPAEMPSSSLSGVRSEPRAVTGKPSSASLPPPSDFDIARAASAAQAILNAAAAAA
jgi:hypothetical protein